MINVMTANLLVFTPSVQEGKVFDTIAKFLLKHLSGCIR